MGVASRGVEIEMGGLQLVLLLGVVCLSVSGAELTARPNGGTAANVYDLWDSVSQPSAQSMPSFLLLARTLTGQVASLPFSLD